MSNSDYYTYQLRESGSLALAKDGLSLQGAHGFADREALEYDTFYVVTDKNGRPVDRNGNLI
jgi:hypothetical protein